MRWGANVSDTAKLSQAGRRAFLRRADALVRKLERIRRRAVRYASPQSIGAWAARVPLPEGSASESGPGSSVPRAETHGDQDRIAGAAGEGTSPGGDGRSASSASPSTLDAERGMRPASTHTDPNGPASSASTRSAVCSDGGPPPPHPDWAVETDAYTAWMEAAARENDDNQPIVGSAWADTCAGRLEPYLDQLDTRRTVSPEPDAAAAVFPVPVTVLIRLGRDIDEVRRYRASLARALDEVERSRRCNPAR
ncbi:hypothetical protein CDD83_3436 [Cordyceps sp. RAO-2017]|nr:hypothetical protein CDD83_3436 [Cordyceps sp. RAO-2017]